MWAFLDGFKDLIDLETLKIFDANELELLICGLQDISVSDWKAHTQYKGEYHPNHPVIVNYWKSHISGDSTAAATGLAGLGTFPNSTTAAALVDGIPVNCRLRAVRPAGSVKASSGCKTFVNLFIVSAPTDLSDICVKDAIHSDLAAFLQSTRGCDIVVLAGGMNAQVGRLDETEFSLGGRFGVTSRWSNNGGRSLQLCAEHKPFLVSTGFRHRARHCYVWRCLL
ncbi:uncharacterized protein DEA37_0007431 [Paragonimus westermani]|uniref:HECT-type E3 ubiquitin transferase n=1 Tax=Paragonimus westermani TaxID=34504 RepID=A0A5J4NTT6_9TREM|nr:uncharacterized protein DEA37_0007431 [Paragonimus westermani]